MVDFSDFETLIIPLIFGILGICNAMIIKVLCDENIIVNEIITGTIILSDLMTIVVVLWFIVGVVLAAVKR